VRGRKLSGWLAGAGLALAAAAPRAASACACVEPPVRTAYARADLVVVATVEHVRRNASSELVVSARVRDAWKVPVPASLTFESEATDCEYEVRENETHLLFLRRGEHGNYWTTVCEGNRTLATASKSLGWLKHHGRSSSVGTSPTPPP
jgi:hypothetical protein